MTRLITIILFLFGLGVAPAMAGDCDGIYASVTICGSVNGGAPGPTLFANYPLTSAQLDVFCNTNNDILIRLSATWQCGSFGASLSLSGSVLGTGPGVDANTLNSRVANYTIANTDCGKTVQLGTGSTGFFTVTIPSVSGFSTTCTVKIVNGDTTNGKAISGLTGVPGNILWPGQAATAKIINGTWYWTEKPGAWVLTSNLTFNVDPSLGCTDATVPTCDGLGTGANAFALAQTGVNYFLQQINVNGKSAKILLADGTYTEQVSCTGKFIGTTEINIAGASGHTASVVWNVALTGAGTGFFFKDYCAIGLDMMTINVANSAVGIATGLFGNVDVFSGVAFGSAAGAQGTTGTAIYIQPGGYGSAVGNFAINGSFNYFVLNQGGIWDWSSTTITGAASLTWASAFVGASSNGQVRATSVTFSGFSGVTGLRFQLKGANFTTNAVDPNTVFATAGSANGTYQQSTTDGNFANTVPTPAPTTTYAGLPTPVAGMYAYISDGKASNCGDSACTAWGTTVTGGSGALKLFIWYNGANWTLAGK